MNIILLQSRLSLDEVDQLLKEFPQYLFLSLSESSYASISADYWARVEVIYGNRLTEADLTNAHQLRWIHVPTAAVNRICMASVEHQGNIIVTNTQDENEVQVAEFVMSIVFAYAKNLFYWHSTFENPAQQWNGKARDKQWSMPEKKFLQIGLSKEGTEICRQASLQKMKVWGLAEKKSFHPYCIETDSLDEVEKYLPEADVVCINLPLFKDNKHWLDEKKIKLLKKDSILIILGSPLIADEDALIQIAKEERIRGIWIDSLFQTPPPASSELWHTPLITISPEAAPRPRKQDKQSFSIFRYNLRQFQHGNYHDMRNVVDKRALLI